MWCQKGAFSHEVNRVLKLGGCNVRQDSDFFPPKFSHLFLKLFYFFFLQPPGWNTGLHLVAQEIPRKKKKIQRFLKAQLFDGTPMSFLVD